MVEVILFYILKDLLSSGMRSLITASRPLILYFIVGNIFQNIFHFDNIDFSSDPETNLTERE